MEYFVIFEPSSGAFYGLSTFENINVPDGCVKEYRSGDLPPDTSFWDTTVKDFVIHSAKKELSKLDFLSRFTMQERIAIRELSKVDLVVDDFMRLLELSQFINIESPLVSQGIDYLIFKNILNNERKLEILKE